MEHVVRGQQDDGRLDQADGNVRHDLARHHLDRPHRHRQQVFHRAPFALARHGQPGHHHQRHRQDHAHQPRHGVVLRDLLFVVELVHAHVEGRLAARQARQRAGQVLLRHGLGQLRGRANGHAGRHGIGGVGLDQQRRAFAAQQPAREVRRYRHHEQHPALGQRRAPGFLVVQFLGDVKVVRRLHRRDEAAREGAVVRRDDGGGHLLGIGVDGVAEQRELHDGQAHDHAEGDAVAAKLQELLQDHAPPARPGKAFQTGNHGLPAKLSVDRFIR
ncbi:hypothetical protein D3C87_593000 [compost metagenome]